MKQFKSMSGSSGFSLVEIMVALVIGMLALLAVMQVASLSEGTKRTTTAGADAQTTGALAYQQMIRDIRMAGYGLAANAEDFSGNSVAGGILAKCSTVLGHNDGRDSNVTGNHTLDYSFINSTFAPLVINPRDANGALIYPAGDGNSDSILINYSGSTGALGISTPFIMAATGTSTQPLTTGATALVDLQVNAVGNASRVGFHSGDMYLAVPTTAGTCMLGEITGLPVVSAAGAVDECNLPTSNVSGNSAVTVWLNHNIQEQYTSFEADCNLRRASRNVNTIVPNFSGSLYNLGPVNAVASKIYTVRFCRTTGCALAVCDVNQFSCENQALVDDPTVWTPLAVGIVALHAQYGMDASAPPAALSGTIGSWNNGDTLAHQPSGAGWQQLLAVRLALVARSSQYEKFSGTTCDTTTATKNTPTWLNDHPLAPVDTAIDVSTSSADWKCYRYHTIQSIETLRNMIWGQQS